MNQPSVWLEFSPLAHETKSINLGQGFPDWEPPIFVQKAAVTSIQGADFSAYARSSGHMPLAKLLASEYSKRLDVDINPEAEIIVTAGASEALYLAITSNIKANDEVILLEPAFDIYLGALKMAQANIKTIALNDDLTLNLDDLERAFSSNTKMFILNSPHNPSGKVFSKEEQGEIAKVISKYPKCIVLSDEVYEHILFDNKNHISFAQIPGMFNQTITISSAGKTFSNTGWKIGWAVGPKELIAPLQFTHQWVMFSVSTPHQEAIAQSLKLAKSNNYYQELRDKYLEKRAILYEGLKEAKLNPIKPEGSFFILCDISDKNITQENDISTIKQLAIVGKIKVDTTTYDLDDYNFSRSLSLHYKVTSIPCSAFYLNKEDQQKWIRFAFCKSNGTLKQAVENLTHLP